MTESQSPTQFEASGHGIRITYTTSGFAGAPIFHYQDHTQNRAFSGAEITTTNTPIGTLVSVSLSTIPDLRTTTFTLFVPTVTLRDGNVAALKTVGITTLHRQSIIGPPVGQDELYTSVPLLGTAHFVVF